jgi:hypothetical protein
MGAVRGTLAGDGSPSKQSVLSKYQLTENLSIGGQAVYASEVFGGRPDGGQPYRPSTGSSPALCACRSESPVETTASAAACCPGGGGCEDRELISIPELLSEGQLRRCRQVMETAEWVDGRGTAAPQAGSVKCNM